MDNLQHFRDTLRTLIDEIVSDDGEHPLNRLYTWADPLNDAADAAGLPQVIHIEAAPALPGNASSVTVRDAFTINHLLAEQTIYRAHPETGRTVRTTTEEPKGSIVVELRRWLTVKSEQTSVAMPAENKVFRPVSWFDEQYPLDPGQTWGPILAGLYRRKRVDRSGDAKPFKYSALDVHIERPELIPDKPR